MKDKSIHLTVEKLSEEIQNMKIYKDFYTDLQVSSLDILLNYWTEYVILLFNIGYHGLISSHSPISLSHLFIIITYYI